MSEMNLNLLPSKAKFQAAKIKLKQKINLAMTIILVVWLLSGGIILLFSGILKSKINAANVTKKNIVDSYGLLKDDIITSQKLKYKAKMVGGVLNSRFEYGKSFEIINGLFPPAINLKNYDLKEGGVFEVKGQTSEKTNVDLLEQTVISINRGENGFLKSAKITALKVVGGAWDFTMEVVLK
jgi:hypothetical protein